MRRTLRLFLCQCLVAGLAFPLTAAAQETRGKIAGTVRDNAGVIPGVRSMPLTFTNLSIQRSFGAGGGRTVQVRFDAQNIFNRQQWTVRR